MSWLKNKIRNWLNSSYDFGVVPEPVRSMGHHNVPNSPQITCIKAMNGTVLHLQTYRPSVKMHGDATLEVSYYVLKEGDSVPDAVAALLVKHNLDQR